MNRDTSASVFVMLIAAIGIIILIFIIVAPAHAIECKERPDDRSYWTYRVIDGERCWYRGHRVLPKSELHWPKEKEEKPVKKPERKKMDPVFPIRAEETGLPAPKTRAPLRSDQAMEIITDGCCWPTLSEFEIMWDKLMQALKGK